MDATLGELENWVRLGKGPKVRRVLSGLRGKKIPRQWVLRTASIARSVGWPELTIQLLNPYVRPKAKSVYSATVAERAVYAAALIRIGASSEALEILRKLNPSEYSDCLLYESHALVSQWRYQESIPVLKRYLELAPLDMGQKVIGQVNLAAAYVHERMDREADALLGYLRDATREKQLLKFYGNTLELSAQLAVVRGRWKDAERYLSEAEAALGESGGLDELFVQKWRAVAQILQNPREVNPLKKVRQRALQLKHWETVRDCDLFLCVARKDEALFRHLYFGTPWEEFRSRLVREFGAHPEVERSHEWNLSDRATAPVLEVPFEKKGMVLQKLFAVLCSDFYRPIRLATIHAKLFPSDYFNPLSSPTRIHQAMKRLRQHFKNLGVPLEILESQGAYRLTSKRPLKLSLKVGSTVSDRVTHLLEELKAAFAGESFDVNGVARTLKISQRSAARLMLDAQNRGLLIRQGKASRTRYHF